MPSVTIAPNGYTPLGIEVPLTSGQHFLMLVDAYDFTQKTLHPIVA